MNEFLSKAIALGLLSGMVAGCNNADQRADISQSTYTELSDAVSKLNAETKANQTKIDAQNGTIEAAETASTSTIRKLEVALTDLQMKLDANPRFDPEALKTIEAKLNDLKNQFDAIPKFDADARQDIFARINDVNKSLDEQMKKLPAMACAGPGLDDAAAVSAALKGAPSSAASPSLVPVPVYGSVSGGETWKLTSSTTIQTQGSDEKLILAAGYLQNRLQKSTGFTLPIDPPAAAKVSCIRLEIRELKDGDAKVPPEGYSLMAGNDGVVIRSASAHGLFNGVQTLLQLLPPRIYSGTVQTTDWKVPAVKIVDWPRFTYRGTMLDVARTFFTVDEVKRYVDEIALLKINHLHLHLTDDQGWRIAISELPELTEIGGRTQIGFPSKPENKWYYTREQYKDIVSYADARFITVVPEFDGPGHVTAAKAAIANLNCNNTVKENPTIDEQVHLEGLCLDDDEHITNVKTYLNIIITNIAALTPGPYIHVGGDEAPGMSAERMSAYVAAADIPVKAAKKTLMGWSQLAEGTIPSGTILQYWGTSDGKDEATANLAQGAKYLMSPGNHAYLDQRYGDDTVSFYGLTWTGLSTIRESYEWDPTTVMKKGNGALAESDVLGVEAPLWSETARKYDLGSGKIGDYSPGGPSNYADYMAFPRLASIAEIGWSLKASHSWDDFKLRLGDQGARWEAFGIGYYRSSEIAWKSPSEVFVINQAPAATAAPTGTP